MKFYQGLIFSGTLIGQLQIGQLQATETHTVYVEEGDSPTRRAMLRAFDGSTADVVWPTSRSEREDEDVGGNKALQAVFKEIEETQTTIKMFEGKGVAIPASTIMPYQEYLAELLKLLTLLKTGEQLDVEQELYTLSTKTFNPGTFY